MIKGAIFVNKRNLNQNAFYSKGVTFSALCVDDRVFMYMK